MATFQERDVAMVVLVRGHFEILIRVYSLRARELLLRSVVDTKVGKSQVQEANGGMIFVVRMYL